MVQSRLLFFITEKGGIYMNTVEPIRDIDTVWDIADYLGETSERNRMMFLFGIYVGIRISDILKLKVRDVRDKTHIYIRERETISD